MIEAITAALKSGAEVTTKVINDGLKLTDVLEIRCDGVVGGDDCRVGGNFRSMLSALNIDPEAIGQEVRNIFLDKDISVESVPLRDSKGDIQHEITTEEAAHYEEVGLRPKEVNGRECLVRDDIDWSQTDAYGQTNKQRCEQGLAPLDQTGRPYELHHVQQRSDGMLAELTRDEHRVSGIDRVLHDPNKTSEINRVEFDQIRSDHWRARASEVQV